MELSHYYGINFLLPHAFPKSLIKNKMWWEISWKRGGRRNVIRETRTDVDGQTRIKRLKQLIDGQTNGHEHK